MRSAPSAELPVGVLIQGTPYVAVYNHADQAFYLQGLFGNPYNIPIGASIDFWGTSAPNSSFALMYGQAISRITYSALFALVGTTYGTGDGTTTFNLPDLRGRVTAGKDDMGGSAASRLTSSYFGTSAAVLGAAGGAESKALTNANLPPYTPAGTISQITPQVGFNISSFQVGGTNAVINITSNGSGANGTLINLQGITPTFTGASQGGTNTPFAVAQPTIIANKILRII